MLPRRFWIVAFVGHVLRRGFADDPDWVYDVGKQLYPAWVDCDPEVAADSAFGACEQPPCPTVVSKQKRSRRWRARRLVTATAAS